jgi:plasmid stabilization system protein ParE
MKAAFLLTDAAADDLAGIWLHLAKEAGEAAADRYLVRIHTACQSPAAMPGMGHFRDELLDRRHRFWLAGSHLLIYRWEERPIKVIRVLHASRDLAAFLRAL